MYYKQILLWPIFTYIGLRYFYGSPKNDIEEYLYISMSLNIGCGIILLLIIYEYNKNTNALGVLIKKFTSINPVLEGINVARREDKSGLGVIEYQFDKIKESFQKMVENNHKICTEKEKLCKEKNLILKDRDTIALINRDVLSKLRSESAALPAVAEWCDKLQAMIDARESGYLLTKKRPALKAHEAVMEAKSEARKHKKEAILLKNIISLYEAEMPEIAETLDYSLDDVLESLNIINKEQEAWEGKTDPAKIYLTGSEWAKLSSQQRNQLALDRYFEYRQKSAWFAGIAYERYIGSLYEKEGFHVIYHGATKGKEDLGIDLICKGNDKTIIVQCKRLSPDKEIPVHEKVIAQTYGAASAYSYLNDIPWNEIVVVVITSYILSDEAIRFANALGVQYRENLAFRKYPSIKCNISRDGERIYHLPFDQQYDTTIIDRDKGECMAESIVEAEELGFRRAFRWRG